MNTLIHIEPKQLRRAADLQERILKLQDELTEILGAPESPATEAPEQTKNRKKYKFSAAARAKMRKAQKERWARIKGENTPAKAEKKPRKTLSTAVRKARSERMKAMWAARRMGKRKFSAAGRAALAAAAKARWAKAKAEGKKSL